jgi:hypothetical protein
MTRNEIRRFATHYAIPMRLAREVCIAGGNWAKAFDLLVARMKQTTELLDANAQPISPDEARQIVDKIEF